MRARGSSLSERLRHMLYLASEVARGSACCSAGEEISAPAIYRTAPANMWYRIHGSPFSTPVKVSMLHISRQPWAETFHAYISRHACFQLISCSDSWQLAMFTNNCRSRYCMPDHLL
jgi:hypothetical protein